MNCLKTFVALLNVVCIIVTVASVMSVKGEKEYSLVIAYMTAAAIINALDIYLILR